MYHCSQTVLIVKALGHVKMPIDQRDEMLLPFLICSLDWVLSPKLRVNFYWRTGTSCCGVNCKNCFLWLLDHIVRHDRIKICQQLYSGGKLLLFLSMSPWMSFGYVSQIAVKCLPGFWIPASFAPSESCTGQDLADLGDRLRDWFQLLHGNAKQNNSGRLGAGATSG